MGRNRIMYDAGLTEANVTPSDLASGQITQAIKEVAGGGAAGTPAGVYTGTSELQWVVEVNDVTGGTAIGTAKFRYSKDGGLSWAGEGLTTATTAVTLEQGVTFAFTAAASGADFALNDRWKFKTILPHNVGAALDYQDRNRSLRFKDATGTKTLLIDYGAAGRQVRAVFLLDHNLSSKASVLLKGNASQSWLTPPVQKSVPWASRSMGAFLEGGWYRYWLLEITDPNNVDLQIEIGKLYVDDYFQPSRSAHLPWSPDVERFGSSAESSSGYSRQSVESKATVFPLSWTRLRKADADGLRKVRDTVWNTDLKLNRPVVFVPDHTVPSDVYLCYLNDHSESQTHRTSGRERWTVSMTLRQVVKL